MARPRREPLDRAQTNLRLPRELLARIDAAAADRDLGRNYLICKLLEEGLDRLIPASELSLTRRPRIPLPPDWSDT